MSTLPSATRLSVRTASPPASARPDGHQIDEPQRRPMNTLNSRGRDSCPSATTAAGLSSPPSPRPKCADPENSRLQGRSDSSAGRIESSCTQDLLPVLGTRDIRCQDTVSNLSPGGPPDDMRPLSGSTMRVFGHAVAMRPRGSKGPSYDVWPAIGPQFAKTGNSALTTTRRSGCRRDRVAPVACMSPPGSYEFLESRNGRQGSATAEVMAPFRTGLLPRSLRSHHASLRVGRACVVDNGRRCVSRPTVRPREAASLGGWW